MMSARPSSRAPHHRNVVLRVVLEIGVLDDQEVAGRGRDPGAHRSPLPAVLLHPDQMHPRHRRDDVRGAVLRLVVDDDDSIGEPSGARSTP
jgi:hypothetical protein